MWSVTKAHDKAAKELEIIFADSGYIDWESIRPPVQSQFENVMRTQSKPIFYRATTPAEAPAAMIKKKNSLPASASLFLLYGQIAPQYHSADNRTKAITTRFSITLQYDTKYLFWCNASTPYETGNKFIKYLDDLLEKLEDAGWCVNETLSEQAFESMDGAEDFNYRKQFIVSKIY